MHEVRATIAAISNATYILNGDLKPKSPLAEQELRTMLEAEVDRVQRMLCRTDPGGPCRIDLDQLVRAQVIAQRALGHDVCWEPSGVTAYGHSDKLAEALHVVLTNATRYAAGAPVEVTTGVWRDMASITVTDSGPGVAAELRATVFDRGVHEDDSPGEGIGLYVARNSVEADGGSITLTDPVPGRGAQFVIRMPCKVTEDA